MFETYSIYLCVQKERTRTIKYTHTHIILLAFRNNVINKQLLLLVVVVEVVFCSIMLAVIIITIF